MHAEHDQSRLDRIEAIVERFAIASERDHMASEQRWEKIERDRIDSEQRWEKIERDRMASEQRWEKIERDRIDSESRQAAAEERALLLDAKLDRLASITERFIDLTSTITANHEARIARQDALIERLDTIIERMIYREGRDGSDE